GGMVMFNDRSAESTLLAAYVTLSPFAVPTDVMRCRFIAEGRRPVAADFVVYGVEAADVKINGIETSITVSAITPSTDNDGCASCGDGSVDAGEECDDANDFDGDGCLSTCKAASCGDGRLWGGVEDCDAGEANSDTRADACRSDCTLPVCGDGIADSDEECDDGNEDSADSCLPGCIAPWCGDGILREEVERCDDGDLNNDADPEACRYDCSLPETCGDADGNGTITATDAKVVLDDAIGLASTCTRARCDVNGSTLTTATDARTVLEVAVGLGSPLDCWLPVVFTFDNTSTLGGLQFVVDYSATGSTFVGAGDAVYCTGPNSDDVLVSFNNDEKASRLRLALVSMLGIGTPAAVAACSFYQPEHELSSSDFVISVTDAVDPELEPIDDPQISVQF
ncbi:MAG: DUF4215 domain-containing protein, partial [Myxococcales bacterium]